MILIMWASQWRGLTLAPEEQESAVRLLRLLHTMLYTKILKRGAPFLWEMDSCL